MNEITSWNDKVQELEDKLNKMKREMVEPFTELLVKLIKEELFDKYQVEKVFWVQYTPYFNDGDSCEFSVREKACIIIGDEDACDYEGSNMYYTSMEDLQKDLNHPTYGWYRSNAKDALEVSKLEPNYFELVETWRKITRVMDKISDDIYLFAFGDHARVTITRDGKIEIDEYGHD